MLASRSAMASLSSPNAGSRVLRGKSLPPNAAPAVGVVCDARRLVRDGGRSGVVGRDGIAPDRLRECEWDEARWCASTGVAVTDAMVRPGMIWCDGGVC